MASGETSAGSYRLSWASLPRKRRLGLSCRTKYGETIVMNWIEVNGTALRYELSGEGPSTLVLVHEMGGCLDSWDQVLPALINQTIVAMMNGIA